MDRTLRTDTNIEANSSLFNRSVRLLVSAEAELVMRAETLPYLSDDLETGGIVVGRWLDDNTLLVFTATGAGPQADHQRLTFAVDVDYANRRLDELRLAYPGADYIGEWHKHPQHFPRPSVGDLHTTLELLQDPAYPNRLVNPIVIEGKTPGQIEIAYYYLEATLADFVQLMPEIVDERQVAALLNPPNYTPPRYFPAQASRPYLAPRKTAWWHSVEGRQRLQAEIIQLKNHGYRVTTSEKLDESTWRIRAVAAKGQPSEFEFQCGGNYPQARPDFSAYTKGDFDGQARSAILSNWLPDNQLYEICQDVRQQRKETGRPLRWLAIGAAGVLAVLVAALVWFGMQQGSSGSGDLKSTTPLQNLAGQQTATAQAAYGAITASVLNQQATRTAEAHQTATAQAIERSKVDAVQATVSAQNNALTAAAASQGAGAPTPTPAAGLTADQPGAAQPYRLVITELTAAQYNQKLNQDRHPPTPFHLMAQLADPSLAQEKLKLQFPNTTVSLPANLPVLTAPFNDLGLGCLQDRPCPVVVVDDTDQIVSLATVIPAYNPQSYYLFQLERN